MEQGTVCSFENGDLLWIQIKNEMMSV
jgi:predicted RNA-binding Zn-ribbon protein involved in translation (DUF1610 family)